MSIDNQINEILRLAGSNKLNENANLTPEIKSLLSYCREIFEEVTQATDCCEIDIDKIITQINQLLNDRK